MGTNCISNKQKDQISNSKKNSSPYKYIEPDVQKESSNLQLNSDYKKAKILNSYKVNKVCGKGFYSKVYLCSPNNNINNDKLYAIKTLKKSQTQNPKATSHIENEFKLLTSLTHKFIIPIIQYFSIAERLYIVYPYYNLDVFSLITLTNKNIPENIIKIILSQVYLVISYLHDNNIIYRDLKPENILLDITEGCIKLIDFGMSFRLINSNMEINEICGTNEYIPPEVVHKCSYGKEFDYWTFGIFAYELLYGVPPFRGDNIKEIFHEIIEKEIFFPKTRDKSDEIEDLIRCLLKKDESERMDWLNVPYHPFFNEINFSYDANTQKGKENIILSDFLQKYKFYSNTANNNNNNKK